jgi:hypothetical protein
MKPNIQTDNGKFSFNPDFKLNINLLKNDTIGKFVEDNINLSPIRSVNLKFNIGL